MTAYLLVFGGLLLLGGRIADLAGRKRVFLAGMVGFAAASILSGVAVDTAMLIAARALQRTCAALMAPAALSLITAAFPDGNERAKASGVFSGIAGSGAAVGLLAGGALTEYVSWRWSLLVNAPIALTVRAGAVLCVAGSKTSVGPRRRLDVPGAVVISAALMALILGCSHAETAGWAAVGRVSKLLCEAWVGGWCWLVGESVSEVNLQATAVSRGLQSFDRFPHESVGFRRVDPSERGQRCRKCAGDPKVPALGGRMIFGSARRS
jgi:MFS family permease